MLTVLDGYTREVLCVAVRPKMNINDVLDVLHRLLMKPANQSTYVRTTFYARNDWLICHHVLGWRRQETSVKSL